MLANALFSIILIGLLGCNSAEKEHSSKDSAKHQTVEPGSKKPRTKEHLVPLRGNSPSETNTSKLPVHTASPPLVLALEEKEIFDVNDIDSVDVLHLRKRSPGTDPKQPRLTSPRNPSLLDDLKKIEVEIDEEGTPILGLRIQEQSAQAEAAELRSLRELGPEDPSLDQRVVTRELTLKNK